MLQARFGVNVRGSSSKGLGLSIKSNKNIDYFDLFVNMNNFFYHWSDDKQPVLVLWVTL